MQMGNGRAEIPAWRSSTHLKGALRAVLLSDPAIRMRCSGPIESEGSLEAVADVIYLSRANTSTNLRTRKRGGGYFHTPTPVALAQGMTGILCRDAASYP
jgi:hypothetical protein